MTSAVGALIGHTFRANSLYDPNETGTGHQPRFYDTLLGGNNTAAPYGSYIVYGAKISVWFNNVGSSYQGGGLVAVRYRNNTASLASSLDEAIERRTYRVKQMGSSVSGSPTLTKISIYVPMSKVFGVSKRGILDDAETYGAAYNANPTKVAHFDVIFQPAIAGTSTIYFSCKIVYYAKLLAKNDVADS